jgi:hypothetical protein
MSTTKVSPQGQLRGTAIFDIASKIQQTIEGKVHKNSPPITQGLKPKKRIWQEGYHILQPDEILSLLVPKQEIDQGLIHGFQRPDISRPHVRRIGEALVDDTPMPTIEIAQYRNAYWLVDGQHRALGAIIARTAIPALIRKMDAEEMRTLFASQSKAMKVNPSTLVLSANDPFSEYVQDAVTDKDNVWSPLVTHSVSSSTKLTPKQMFDAVSRYVSSNVSAHVARHIESYKFDKDKADELGKLLSAFGTKRTNPLAFRPISIKGITYAAVIIIRRRDSRSSDIDRWMEWMPKFPFEQYPGLRRSKELATFLIYHWNKRLSSDNKIALPEELT